jgi:hypothetical protein
MRQKEFGAPSGEAHIEKQDRPAELSLKKNIGAQYDKLLKERKKLLDETQKRGAIFYDIAVIEPDIASPELLENICQKFLERVRKNTHLLDLLDAFGIEIFKKDLDKQPSFPGVEIQFASKRLFQRNVRNAANGDHWSGMAEGGELRQLRVDVDRSMPDLRHQFVQLLHEAQVLPEVQTLIHELIHIRQKQFVQDRTNNAWRYVCPMALIEAQAHFSGV